MQRPSKVSNNDDEEFVDVSGNDDKGILKKIVKAGDGNKCPEGVVAIVHYTGKLTDGTIFDCSKNRGRTPFSFNIGSREVILGWDKGVATMTKGEVSIFKLAPQYAYGDTGVGPIPPKSTLIFEVELIGWKPKANVFGIPATRMGQLLGVIFCFLIFFGYKYYM